MAECEMCGKCCECIILKCNSDTIQSSSQECTDQSYGWGFALRNFTEISRDDALKINPYLIHWEGENIICFYYTCKHFCTLTKKCIVHEIRPYTCSEFPWYGKEPIKQPLYSENCSFHKDLNKLNKPKVGKGKKNGSRKSN